MRYKRAKSGTPYSNSRERVYDILKKYLGRNESYGNINPYGNPSYKNRYGKKKTKDNYQPKPKYNPNNSKYYPAKEKPPDAKMPSPLKHYGWTETTTPRPPGTNYGMHELNEKVGKLSREAREIRQAIEKENQEISELLKKLELNPEDPELLGEALKKLTEPSEINGQLAAHSENLEKIFSDTASAEAKNKEDDEKAQDSDRSTEHTSEEKPPAESKPADEEVWPGELTKEEAEALYREITELGLFEDEKLQPLGSGDAAQTEPVQDSEESEPTNESEATREHTEEPRGIQPSEVLDRLEEKMNHLGDNLSNEPSEDADILPDMLATMGEGRHAIEEATDALEQAEPLEPVEPLPDEESEEG